jgi:hypothetical protein
MDALSCALLFRWSMEGIDNGNRERRIIDPALIDSLRWELALKTNLGVVE